ncbi:matrixin family metalloprotease [Thioalkalivibrio sp. XN8]|uniref:matrixin family metalloprotease n=1 Tax=Thioalkalivibrio sp. XN8 TaxID=2712863 RepID=UPI0013EA13DE|nr:matrixin family metalloprotease [Thioalkalivibrio sp. XN8]NGP52893.1 matrixin family metalloprotease [Thioalkalivibrio sp. XN8]
MPTRTANLVLAGLLLIGVTVAARQMLRTVYPPDPHAHAPCAIPVHYALGKVDPGFGLDRITAVTALAEAVNLWQAEAGRTLFIESTDPRAMQVELSFDERQQGAVERRSLRSRLELDQGDLEREQATLQSWSERIERNQAARERRAAELQPRLERHEAAVAGWNADPVSRSESQRRALEAEGAALRAELAALERRTNELKADIDAYNRRAEDARRRAGEMRSRVERYNATAADDPVESGRYSYDYEQGRRIEVFRAASFDELVWVLAHEFGHALGIGHVDEPGAIMHGMVHEGGALEPGRGRPVALSAADREALGAVCGNERLGAAAGSE